MIQIAATRFGLLSVFFFLAYFSQAGALPHSSLKNTPLPEPELVTTLSELMTLLDVPHQKNLPSLIKASQIWRRKPDQERWEVAELKLDDKKRTQVIKLLTRLKLIEDIRPESKQFRYAILLSGTVPRMRTRLEQLVKNWQSGVRFDEIIFLTSQRILNPEIDRVDELVNKAIGANKTADEKAKARPATEFEAAQLVYLTTPMPEDMRKVKIHYTATARDWLGNRWQRKNTREGIHSWLATKPPAGSALIVSDQPHINYQGEVAYQEFPEDFPIDFTGEAALPNNKNLINYLDALALWLHNLELRLNR